MTLQFSIIILSFAIDTETVPLLFIYLTFPMYVSLGLVGCWDPFVVETCLMSAIGHPPSHLKSLTVGAVALNISPTWNGIIFPSSRSGLANEMLTGFRDR